MIFDDLAVNDADHEYIFCRNQSTYEEILSWRAFSFDTSHSLITLPIKNTIDLAAVCEDSVFGIEESERIINNVLSKQKGY